MELDLAPQSESALFSILLEGLPDENETIDALDSSTATIESKLDSLSAKAERLYKNTANTTNTAQGLMAK
ncbi:hypothetical protein IFR05_017246 [Cadophora sp. M221]|nr:hypothetical protein IFR05_017246 [Cadophora sp. M221]